MEILFSDILPLTLKDSQMSIKETLLEQLLNADTVEIAVGYISKASLEELDEIVSKNSIKKINLIIGMYFLEGMPEGTYRAALAVNEKWQASGVGEIRMVKAFKYHGKAYVFAKNGAAFSAVIGSANLGVLKTDAGNLRQYELSALTKDSLEIKAVADHIHDLQSNLCSANIADITNMPLIREKNVSLTGIETVDQIPQAEVSLYARHKTQTSFILPIKVPAFDERHIDDFKHFTKSNINVCYAAPRSARKPRDWYETQFTVSKSITLLPGYPEKNAHFFVVTDDGYTFKAHTTSDGNKQFSAVGDELILGRWIKGRLAAAGLVTPVNNTQLDHDRMGMITKEMLDAYGCNTVVLTKTDQKAEDEDGNTLDVWFLSFEAAHGNGDEV